jgi:hypothetical protein
MNSRDSSINTRGWPMNSSGRPMNPKIVSGTLRSDARSPRATVSKCRDSHPCRWRIYCSVPPSQGAGTLAPLSPNGTKHHPGHNLDDGQQHGAGPVVEHHPGPSAGDGQLHPSLHSDLHPTATSAARAVKSASTAPTRWLTRRA